MTTKPSDLIAIANPELAEKLAEKKKQSNKTTPKDAQPHQTPDEPTAPAHKTYRQEIWRAVFTLNIFRYAFVSLISSPNHFHRLCHCFIVFSDRIHFIHTHKSAALTPYFSRTILH